MISSKQLADVAQLWYPIMITQMMGKITEAKACELLGLGMYEYREEKQLIARIVVDMLQELPSPLGRLLNQMLETAT